MSQRGYGGAHYEIVRRSIERCSLPPIQKLRELLRSEWSRAGCIDYDDAVKMWPLYVINGGMQAADDPLRSVGVLLGLNCPSLLFSWGTEKFT